MKILVLTVSDRAYNGIYIDESGPAIESVLLSACLNATVTIKVVPDEADKIEQAFCDNLDMDIILTTGGTGLSPRDITPDVTERFCERLVPGIAEALRTASSVQTKNAILSRAVAGQKGGTLIINLPGSVRGAKFCAEFLSPLLSHAVAMMRGDGH